MPVTGLRSRFFLTILAVTLVVTASAVYLYSVFLKQERLNLIDQQVRETATILLDSELAELRKLDFEKAESIISEELGDTQVGKFFIIRNAKGQTIFESSSVEWLPMEGIPQDETWFEMTIHGKYVRGLNLKLPRVPDRTLQVGLILDEELLRPGYLSKNSLIFVVVALLLGFFASWFLTSFLLKPIALLESFLSEVSKPSRQELMLPKVPANITANPSPRSKDEFERMLAGLNALIDRVNKNYQLSRLWAYQMAHELKTPLSILGLEVESLSKKAQQNVVENVAEPLDVKPVFAEIHRISETINSFLSWAELENSNQQRHLFANRLGSLLQSLIERLHEPEKRLRLVKDSDLVVLANPQHLDQLITNLIKNALVHSPPDREVLVELKKNELVIADHGPGIPAEVMGRLGEPFNRGGTAGSSDKGHGLGLAWVKSVCRHYGWTCNILCDETGTKIHLIFPEDTN